MEQNVYKECCFVVKQKEGIKNKATKYDYVQNH